MPQHGINVDTLFQSQAVETTADDNASIHAYRMIKQMILSDHLVKGNVTSVSSLCKEINIGRTPVTIACQRLENEGFLTIVPKQGILIRFLSLDEANEIYEMRSVLEEYVAKKTVGKYDESDYEYLESCFSRQEKAATKMDSIAYMVEDRVFHTFFVNKLGNQHIISTHAILYDRSFSVGAFNCKNFSRMSRCLCEHKTILDALRAGDSELFASSTREHVLNGLASLFSSYSI